MGTLRDRVRRASSGVTGPPPAGRLGVDPARDAIAWAYDLAIDPTTVYLDTETTGLDGTAEVIDVAVVAADGRVVLQSLVRPTIRIPSDASAIHGIRDRDVAGAPAWPDIYERLRPLLMDRAVVVYNAPFDRRMLEQSCRRHDLACLDARWECAMRGYAAFRGQPGARGGFRFHKLEHAVARFGSAPGGHRAAADALACRAVVHGMAALTLETDDIDL